MSQYTLEDLPNEILIKIVSHVSDDEDGQSPKPFIKSVRLLSQKFNQVSSVFLIDQVNVRLTSTSLSALEKICLHPEFRKSVTQVTIDMAYYDIDLAQDIDRFGDLVGGQFFNAIELTSMRGMRNQNEDTETFSRRLDQLWNVLVDDGFDRLDLFKDDDSCAKPHQRNVINLHKEYTRLYTEQEKIRRGNQHIRLLAAALKNLAAVHSIRLSDSLDSKYAKTGRHVVYGGVPLDHPDFFISALVPERWCGKTNPPIELLSDLLSSLGNAGIRPQTFILHVGVPLHLLMFRPTRIQSAGIQPLVSKSLSIDLSFQAWSCRHEGIDDSINDLSRNEILSLGSLIAALTSTSTLRQLAVAFHNYPCSHQLPNASLSDLLPIYSMSWPNLWSIDLRHIPFSIEGLIAFVNAHQYKITSFTGVSMYLTAGDWETVLDVFRSLESLEDFGLSHPQGGRFDAWISYPRGEAEEYVLRKIVENPL